MAYKKSLIFAAIFAVAGVATVGSSTFARGLDGGTTGMSEQQKQKVEERKAEIKERIETKKAERATKLADKRLEQCEKRETRVNTIFSKATERNAKHLAVFQKIEERVKAFYASKNITAEGYDAAVKNADEKEAAAVAAIETSTETTFDCATADSTKPSGVIKEAMTVRHAALKDYRTAIKDLILVVKQHNGQNRSSTDDTTTEPETETETENETETETEPTTEGQQ